MNRIDRLLISMLASSAIDRGFGPDRIKPKTRMGIWCFFTKYAALMSENKADTIKHLTILIGIAKGHIFR